MAGKLPRLSEEVRLCQASVRIVSLRERFASSPKDFEGL